MDEPSRGRHRAGSARANVNRGGFSARKRIIEPSPGGIHHTLEGDHQAVPVGAECLPRVTLETRRGAADDDDQVLSATLIAS